ncbi:MAG: glutamine--fructose-6-phosphate transaminase (isomerizing) [Bacteroidales bacterium]|nr:glutamine--fructose-6-phosphate transaminase (isomerizing) [Bacteroidales bacterium]
MCGIIGYIGTKEAYPILINGLKRLEYRGYDSAGIAIAGDKVRVYKQKGKVHELENFVGSKPISGHLGIGHTRWATHGEPEDKNAHPHRSMHGHFILVHNGIIENYNRLRERLTTRGYRFQSDTDTEVLVNLMEYIYLKGNIPAEMAIRLALKKMVGAYGLGIICADEPDRLFAVRKGSPLVLGIGKQAHFIASDTPAIMHYTRKVVYLKEDEMAILKSDDLTIQSRKNNFHKPVVNIIEQDIGDLEKGSFPHYMLKEIFEQPASIRDTFRGRISEKPLSLHLGGLFHVLPAMMAAPRIIILGCGTSWHAGLIGEYLIEEFARIPVEVEYASEFRYRHPVIHARDVIIAISQSGETADTMAAIRKAKEAGSLVLGICNVVGSSIPRETVAGVYTHAGPEIGVASTKAFTSQVTVLTMIAMLLAWKKELLSREQLHRFIHELEMIPEKIQYILKHNHKSIRDLADKYKDVNNFLYLGRGYFFPVALEGALKLKEISYIHAEGYPAAEMKHGPIALIDENMPVVVIAPKDNSYDKIVSNIREIKARKGKVIAIVNEKDTLIRELADYVLEIPSTLQALSPLLAVIPLQLLAYHIAVLRGCNVDQPRNLAKSVTVE